MANEESNTEIIPPALDTVEESFEYLDDTIQSTQTTRQELLTRITSAIEHFDFALEAATDLDIYQAQLKMVDHARQLLNDLDNAARNHTNLKLKQSALSEQHQANVNIAEILSKVKLDQAAWAVGDPNKPGFKNEAELEATLKTLTKDEVISKDELEVSSSKLPRDKLKGDDLNPS